MQTSSSVERVSSYIDGFWEGSDSLDKISVHNPATGELVGEATMSSVDHTRYAINSARKAFDESEWKESPATRAKIMYRLANLLRENSQQLARLLTVECGHTLAESKFEVLGGNTRKKETR